MSSNHVSKLNRLRWALLQIWKVEFQIWKVEFQIWKVEFQIWKVEFPSSGSTSCCNTKNNLQPRQLALLAFRRETVV